MSQVRLRDNEFDRLIRSIRDNNCIPKYKRNRRIISVRGLLEPLNVLTPYIPKNISITEEEVKRIISPFNSFNEQVKDIKIRSLIHTEEQKRALAFLLGFVLSKSGHDDQEVSLAHNYFFGYLFEYLYFLEKQKEYEKKEIGIVDDSATVTEDALNVFIMKYLDNFKRLADRYSDRRHVYTIELKNASERLANSSQDGLEEFETPDDSFISYEKDTYARFVAFDRLLNFVATAPGYSRITSLITEGIASPEIVESKIRVDGSEKYEKILERFSKYNERKNKLSKKKLIAKK